MFGRCRSIAARTSDTPASFWTDGVVRRRGREEEETVLVPQPTYDVIPTVGGGIFGEKNIAVMRFVAQHEILHFGTRPLISE